MFHPTLHPTITFIPVTWGTGQISLSDLSLLFNDDANHTLYLVLFVLLIFPKLQISSKMCHIHPVYSKCHCKGNIKDIKSKLIQLSV